MMSDENISKIQKLDCLGFLTQRQGLWPGQCKTNVVSAGMYTIQI